MGKIHNTQGSKDYTGQKETVGYSDEAEERDTPENTGDDSEEPSLEESREQQRQMRKDGTIEKAKNFCSLDMTDTIDTLNEYIFKIKNGYLLNLNSHYKFIIDNLRDKYFNHIDKNDTRYNELLNNEKKYFYQKHNKKLYDDLLEERALYLISIDKNDDNETTKLIKNLKKSLVVNEKYRRQEIIIQKQFLHYQKEKQKLNDSIDDYSNFKDIESTKLYTKNIDILKQIGLYVYIVYFLYLCVFISILLITDLKNTITSIPRLLFLFTIIVLPDFIYPNFYFHILVPFVEFVYNNNFLTKELPPNVYEDISKNKF